MLLAHMWLLAGAIMRPALRTPSFSSAARGVSPLSCATTAVEDAVDDDAPPLLRVLRAGGLDAAQAQEVYERRPPGKLPLHAMGRAGRRRVAGLPAAILAGWKDVFADAGSETAGRVVVPFLKKAA